MDLHYCDLCGTIIQGQDLESCRVSDSTICGLCRDNAGASRRSANPREEDASLSSVLKESNLDLFSSETIAKRKAQTDPRTQSRLTLVDDPSEPGGGSTTTATVEKSPITATHVGLRMTAPGESSTMLSETAPPDTGSTQLRLTDDEGEGTSIHESGTQLIHPQPPAEPVQRWKINCVQCSAKLAIKPIERPSRMTCPKCQCKLVIHADQRVTVMGGGGPARPRQETTPKTPPDSGVSGTDTEETLAPTPTQSPAEVVSQLASMLRDPGDGGTATAGLRTGSTATPIAPPSTDSLPLHVQQPQFESTVPDEMDTTTRPAPDPDLDDNLQSLLGNAPLDDSIDALHPAEATGQTLGAEATVLGILICALPVFAGLGLTMAMENAEAAEWLELVGESVRDSLRSVQSWFGTG